MRIISQVYVGDGQFMLQLGGLSSETKPTDAFVATGSQFFEDDTDAVFTFSGLTWNLEKNGQMKDLPVVTSTDNGKILKVDNGVWSIGIDSGSSLPSMTGKNGKVLGVTLDAQDHEQAEWVTPSGGGAEKFVVTLTQENDTWTADKTVAEIVAADEAGKIMVAKYPRGGINIDIPLNTAMEYQGMYGAIFAGFVAEGGDNKVVAVQCMNEGSGDAITIIEQQIPTSSNAPLIVTMTLDEQTPSTFVGDKTYLEVYTAFVAGRSVRFSLAMDGATSATNVDSVVYDPNSGYEIGAGTFTMSGAGTDYISFTSH